jgi:hypothetical protein
MASKAIVNLKQRPVSVVLRSELKSVGLACRVKDGFVIVDSESESLEELIDEIDRKLNRILGALDRLEQAK